ncbi:MAG: fatty acid CoA ligase family protein [Planctomycetota bacterium]
MARTAAASGATDASADGTARVNVALRLDAHAAASPDRAAVRTASGGASPRFADASFAEVATRSRRIGSGLLELGLERGARVCLFVRPGADFVACTYGLVRAGLVPVLIDPGMGRRSLLRCVEKVGAAALVGVARAHVARTLWPEPFREIEHTVLVGGAPPGLGGRLAQHTLDAIEARGSDAFEGCDTRADDVSAILFTSGSTGPPKGVVYTHGIFDAQVEALRELYGFEPGEADVACFPLFALFDNAMGVTSVFPEMDPSRPARCDPARIVGALRASAASTAFASPAVWKRVVPWCESNGVRLDALRRAVTAGAPIPPELVRRLVALLGAGGRAYTPYGATECLPVANVSDVEIAVANDATEHGAGNFVGRPVLGSDVVVARVRDEPVPRFDPGDVLPTGEVGEIWVRSRVATPQYLFDERATALAKVRCDDGTFFHRMGDLGRLDETGGLWFQGRVNHRIRTADGDVPCVPVENLFLAHPEVERCALVGVGEPGAQRAVLVVEPKRRGFPFRARRPELAASILAHGRARSERAGVVDEVLFERRFPTDPRHNAKIVREELAARAARRLA